MYNVKSGKKTVTEKPALQVKFTSRNPKTGVNKVSYGQSQHSNITSTNMINERHIEPTFTNHTANNGNIMGGSLVLNLYIILRSIAVNC